MENQNKAKAEKTKKYNREYRKKNPEKIIMQNKKWRENNPDKHREYNKQWHRDNPISGRERAAKWAKKNPERVQKNKNKWSLKNKEKIKEYHRKRQEEKRKNPVYRLNNSISDRIRKSLKNGKSGHSWELLVGWTLNQLKKHIEKQFTTGMNWGNYGEWHLDHKIPLAAHNFINSGHTDFKKAWALSNLQPMWAKENMSKGAKLFKPFQPSLLL